MPFKKALSLVLVAAAAVSAASTNVSAAEKDSSARPHMDLAFCIDTTGSMQNEIDMVKRKTKELVAKLSTGKPAPIVRVGLVAYRDRGDEYVTKVYQFSDNIDQVVKDISELKAAGGGDGPESVNEGLHVALNSLNWSSDKDTAKLLFLIGDAGPHDYPNDYKWEDESHKAIARGIQINTIACSGLESYPGAAGVDVFKQIAKLSDGKYDTLAYRTEITDASGKKSTIVTAAGARYKVADSEHWKSAAAAGRMEKIAMPASPVYASAGMAMDAAYAPGVAGAKGMYRTRSASMAAPMMSAEGAGGGGAGFAATSRSDSNLDEIVLSAARAKAKKSLKVEY